MSCASTDRSVADTVVVVPQTYEAPRTAVIPYAVPLSRARHAPRRRHVSAAPGATIATVSRRYRIDPLLLDAIVARESAFRTNAVSPKGALGLMQVMPATARGLGVSDPSQLLVDPALNLVTGATYLKQLQGQFGNNLPAVLAAYNAGPGAVRRYRGVPRYRETQAYVATIMKRYQTARRDALR